MRQRVRGSYPVLFCVLALALNAGNLLQNPGFTYLQNGVPQGWTAGVDGGSKAYVSSGEGRRRAVICKVRDGKSKVAGWQQDVAVRGGASYHLAGHVWGNGRLFCYEYDQAGTYLGQTTGISVKDGQGEAVRTSFKTLPRTARCGVRFELYGAKTEGKGMVDNAYFGEEEPPENLGSDQAVANHGVPTSWREVSYDETNSFPEVTQDERSQGLMVFSRPLTCPVFPETRPGGHERITHLETFGARGQRVSLNFSVFPLRKLGRLQVQATYPDGGAKTGEVRRISYECYRVPNYASVGHFQRMPGYLVAPVRVDVPQHEPQRFVVNVTIPETAPAGVCRGEISVMADGQVSCRLPYAIQVLPFRLSRDPHTYISAYAFGPRLLSSCRPFWGDPAWMRKASVNSYRRMRETGFTFPPTMYINYDQKKHQLYLLHLAEERADWRAAGLPERRLAALDNFSHLLYRKHMGSEPDYSPADDQAAFSMPPPAFFAELEELFRDFLQRCKAAGLPEIFILSHDEPKEHIKDYVRAIYACMKRAGAKTFTTSCSFRQDVSAYVDAWNDGAFVDSLESVRNHPDKEFWCYPNNSVYAWRDASTMSRGGRMTFGYGFWRSGYTTLMPWMWSWDIAEPVPGLAPGGQRFDEHGEVEMEWEWESIREGIVDGAYVYTLQEAIVRREGSPDAGVRALVGEARELLNDIWSSVPPERNYYGDNHWRDDAFVSRRKELASIILRLTSFPELNRKCAPSRLRELPMAKRSKDMLTFLGQEAKAGNVFVSPVEGKAWRTNGETEGTMALTSEGVADFHLGVDFRTAGNQAGFKQGTPSLEANFYAQPLDLRPYQFLSYKLKVSSNRHVIPSVNWPHTLLFFAQSSDGKVQEGSLHPPVVMDPGIWHEMLIPLKLGLSRQDMSRIMKFWFYFKESDYRHGDRLNVQVKDAAFIGFKRPLIVECSAETARTTDRKVHWTASLMGTLQEPIPYQVTLCRNYTVLSQQRGMMSCKESGGCLEVKALEAGAYFLRLDLGLPGTPWQRKTAPLKVVKLEND